MDSFSQKSDLDLVRIMSTKSISAASDEGFIDGLGTRTYSTLLCTSSPTVRRLSIPVAPPSPVSPVLDVPQTPMLATPQITRTPSILDHPSVLSTSQNGNYLKGYMSDLKRSASKSLFKRRVSIVEANEREASFAEIQKLTDELNAREEELVNACEVGQSLVEELEAARAELQAAQENELKLLDTIETMQNENTKLYRARVDAQREINALKVITDKATEEINMLKEIARKNGSMQRRRNEEELQDRFENEQWLLQQAMLRRSETVEEQCSREEYVGRMDVVQEEEAELVGHLAKVMQEGMLLLRKVQFTTEKKETVLMSECSLLKAKIQAMEVSAEERKSELREHFAATQQVHFDAIARRNSCSSMMERASQLVFKIKEACVEYEMISSS
eukprot:TRINITY_DN20765_c0_g1_i1.p1 TRINITY_DN20765_c0_g1~~TRINITY_DN20765_c0_g1_i1.p1  ORF type:complete len:390 (+),score=169.11 TRINITY_DN20765_c0_g1_i1:39-1208(+)